MKYQIEKLKEQFLMWIVWHLPKSIVYWSSIRLGVQATTGKYSHQVVPELHFMDAVKRWEDK